MKKVMTILNKLRDNSYKAINAGGLFGCDWSFTLPLPKTEQGKREGLYII